MASFQFGLILVSLLSIGGGQPAWAAPTTTGSSLATAAVEETTTLPSSSSSSTSLLLLSDFQSMQTLTDIMGRSAKETLGLTTKEEKEARLREFDAKFEADYQQRNEEYAAKLRAKKQADAKALEEEKEFVSKTQEFAAVGGIATDRGDSILPKTGVAKAGGIFPDIFDDATRTKIQAREEIASKKQQESIQLSEKVAEEERLAAIEKREAQGKMGDDDVGVGSSDNDSGPTPKLDVFEGKTVQVWEI